MENIEALDQIYVGTSVSPFQVHFPSKYDLIPESTTVIPNASFIHVSFK